MIKSWKTAIETIGFTRWKYQKHEHTHCMAFRKKLIPCRDKWLEKEQNEQLWSQMLYIQQDLQDFKDETISYISTETYENHFSKLPFSSSE